MIDRFGLHRVEVWISAVLLVAPWLLHGVEYPIQLVQELDHCPELGCDFVRHYLPQAESARARVPDMNSGWFYPPLLAMLLIPFNFLNQATLLWTIVNVLGVVVLIRMIRAHGSVFPTIFTVALCATSLPILHAIKWGQVSVWLAIFLCVSMFPGGVLVFDSTGPLKDPEEGGRFDNMWSAWLLGLAASIKVYPIVFVLLPLLRERLSWVMHCVLSIIVLGVLLPWLWLGDDVWQYVYAVYRGQQAVADMGSLSGGQALGPTLQRWFISGEFIGVSTSGDWSKSALILVAPWLKPTLIMGAVLVLGKLVWYIRKNRIDTARIFALLILIHLLIQPGWVHYFCWLPIVHVWCWYRARNEPKLLWLLGLAILLERMPLLFLTRPNYFAFSRAGWMTIVLLLTLMVILLLSSKLDGSASLGEQSR